MKPLRARLRLRLRLRLLRTPRPDSRLSVVPASGLINDSALSDHTLLAPIIILVIVVVVVFIVRLVALGTVEYISWSFFYPVWDICCFRVSEAGG